MKAFRHKRGSRKASQRKLESASKSMQVSKNGSKKFQMETLESRILLSDTSLPMLALDVLNESIAPPEAALVLNTSDLPTIQSQVSKEGQSLDVAFNSTTGEMLLANNNEILRLDPSTNAILGSFDIPGSDFTSALGMQILPESMASLGGTAVDVGSLLVTNGTNSFASIFAVDSSTGAVKASLNLGQEFDAVAGVYHPARHTLFVVDTTNDRIVEINPSDGSVVNSFSAPFAIGAGGLAVSPRLGTLWLGSSDSSSLAEITPDGTLLQLLDISKFGIDSGITGLTFKSSHELLAVSPDGTLHGITDPAVTIRQDYTETQGALITVSVDIDDATSLEGVDFGGAPFQGLPGITYDTTRLNVIAVRLGDVAATGTLLPNVNEAAGTIIVALALPTGTSAPSGSLILIDFEIVPTAADGPIAIDLQRVGINENKVIVDPAPKVGVDDTDGIINIQNTGVTFGISDATVTEGNSGTRTATFTVTKYFVGPDTDTVSVDVQTGPGTAPSATTVSDFVALLQTLTFLPGESTKTVTVTVNGDATFEQDETFFVNLSNPVNQTNPGFVNIGYDNHGIGTITNDDAPPVFSIGDMTLTEGNSATKTFSFTVTKTGATALASSVQYTTANGTATAGSDYVAKGPTTLSFAAATTQLSATVLVNGDSTTETDETFFVNLTNAISATIGDGQGLGTITNDDGLAINQTPVVNDQTFTVAENAANGTGVGTILATDADAGQILTFSVTGGTGQTAFDVSAAGAITVSNSTALNFETTPSFTLNVTVTDNGTSPLSDTAIITINLTNVNEAPVVNAATFSLAENSSNGTAVGTVTAADPDAGTLLTYSITGGDTGGAFAINAATGAITVANSAALIFETTPTFSLTVQAADNGTPVLTGINTITINLINVNEPPTVNPATFILDENSANGTVVGTVTAADADTGTVLTFSITGGNTGDAFAINAATGAITVANSAALNFETKPTFSLIVQVADNGTPVLTASNTITINLKNVNEAPVVNAATFTVDENSANGTAVGTVMATDPDAGTTLTYSITSGNTGVAFAIDAATGAITVNNSAALIFETTPTFSLAVRATDNGTPVLTGNNTITINLNNVNEPPVVNAATFTLAENSANGTAVGIVTAADADTGTVLTFSITGGNSGGAFAINAATGAITVATSAALNFETTPSFNLTVTATDNGTPALSGSNTITVNLTNVNEASVAVNDAYSTNEDTPLTIAAPGILANDTDVDSNPLTAILNVGPASGSLTLNANGSFTYTPNANFSGTDSFTYHANDGTANSNIATVTITVNAVNDAPVASNKSYETDEDVVLNIAAPGVLATDSDVDGDVLTAVLVSGVAHGTLTLNPNGSFVYTPAANFNGVDAFMYKADDGHVNSPTATVSIFVNEINDTPVANNDSYATDEDTVLNIAAPGVLANDTDVEGNPLTAVLNAGPASGSLTLNANGSFTYTPNANFNGTDSFTYHANDGTANSNIATVTITVNAVNDAPVAVNDNYGVNKNDTLNVTAPGILANDTDVDTAPLTAVLNAGPASGTLTLNANGSFTYTPNANFSGTDSFTYHANDGTLNSNIATVTITVNAVNAAPVAVNDSYTTNEDTLLTIATPGVLANDTDADGNSLTAALNATTSNGALTLNANGSFTYAPNANFSGTDSFTYHANDGTLNSNIATVTITVNAVNDAPVAVNDSYTTNEDTPLTIAAPGVLANDTDVDTTPLTAVLDAGPASGSLTLNGNGSFTYTPNANFSGTDSFTYHANDGTANSNIATVTITVNAVNDAPVAVNDSYTTNEDTPLTITAPGILANDTDVDTTPLTAVLDAGPASGSLTLNGNGSFTYTPNANFSGTDSFTYHANDGTLNSNIATVTITVTAVNDAPVAVNDSYTTNEDTPLTIAAPGVLANDTDVDTTPLTAVLNVGPVSGGLTLNANGSFTYTPNANFSGTDSFTYHANDGTLNSNIATVTITVTAVNDAPVAVNDSYTTNEDTPLTIAAPGVLANDTDVDTAPLTAVLNAGPSSGSLTLNGNGSFTYTPNANFSGTDSFTYHANDGTANSNIATVTITVNAVNDAPVAANDSYTTNEDTPLTIAAPGVLTNDTDVDTTPLTAALNATTSNGALTLNANGSFTYTPNANFSGTDSFTYHANDGTLNSNIATVTITVNAVNDAPVAVNDSYTTNEDTPLTIAAPGVLTNDTDVDTAPLTAALNATTSNGALTLNANGSFTYTPNANFSGTDSFTYHANDGTVNSNIATVTITVNAVNDAPVAANDSYTTNEDTPLTIAAPGVLANDTDVDTAPLTAVLNVGPVSGGLTLNANGSFTYTPNANFNGTDSFTYHANDGTANSNIATVTITVNAVNDAPVAVNDNYGVNSNGTLNVTAPGVLGNDTDVDGNPLTAVLNVGPVSGGLTLNANGSFTYTPNANFNGTDSFTYHANDGTLNSNIASVTITVNAVNAAPVAANDSYTTNEDTPLTITAPGVLANDTDVDENPLTAVLNVGPASGSLTLNANGSFTYTPNANFSGTDSFTYHANDGTVNSNIATVTITVNAVNDAPVAVNDSYTTNEDTPLTIAAPGVLANDTDVDTAPLTAVLGTGPSSGGLTLNANGSFTYTPNANFSGTDSFTYRANDGTVNSNIATVTITVNAVNDAPVAVNDSYTTNEDTPLTIAAPGVLANDTDVDTAPLTAVLNVGPASGSLTLNANGSFTYTPNANFSGTDSFTYRANDGTVNSNIATVTITVNAVNDAPVAVNDSYTTNEDTPLTIAALGVLANDTDVDTAPLTAVLNVGPASGTLTLNGNGSFTYTPNADFNGTDSFTYHANDGTANSNIATVTITVNAVNDAAVAVNDSYTTNEDTPLTIAAPGVLANDTDVDGNPLTVVLGTGPSSGGLTLNGNGSFTYTPNANFSGTDSFTYRANDGTVNSNIATVTITVNAVNDAPVAVNDSYTTNEDTPLTIAAPGVLANDTDVDTTPLTAALNVGPASGSLTLNGNGSFTYTPNANFSGTDSFTYHANDGTANSNIATVTITVNAVNDAPVAVNDSYTTNEDTPLTITAPGVLANDTDVDTAPLTAVLNAGPGSGSLTLNANGSFTYTPNANFNGTDSFTYHANDGTVNSNIATVTITVNAVNDAPVAVNDNYGVNNNSTLNVTAPGVLANDTDVDGNPLTAALNATTSNGALTLNANGSFTYTPNANFSGTDSFTYRANDGTANSNIATVTITVNAVNDAPVAVNDSYTTNEDTPLTIAAPGVLANDTDVDGNPLTAALNATTSNGALTLNANGSFTYTPNANFSGTDSFTYRANDGTVNSNIATVTITVNAVNDAPVAVNDSYTTNEDTPLTIAAPGVLSNDTDVDTAPLTAVLNVGPASGTLTLNANGSFTYTPNANFSGTDSFTYRANDGTVNSNIATVTITVNAVNDAPVAANDSYTTNEDTPLTIAAPGVLANDTDVDTAPLTAVLNVGPASGTLTLNGNGSFTYTPNANFSGTDSFTYHANDGTANSNIAMVTITVSAVNDAPVAVNDSYTTNEDTPLTIAAPGVLANDTDVDTAPLTAVLNAGPGSGSLTLNGNGSFTYTPNANFSGTDSFTYHANDGTANSNIATVTITVNAVNDAPVAVNDSYTTNEDTPLTIAAPGVLANDTDVDTAPLTAVLNAGPSSGSLTLNGNGSFTYTPNANFSGTDSFTYHANDGTANSSIATVTITVTAVNDAPVAVNDSYGVNSNSTLIVTAPGVLANDTDVDTAPLTAVLNAGPSSGSLTLNGNGSFTYTPNANFSGTDSFTYHANDGTANSNIATVTITVTAVNAAPVVNDQAFTVAENTANGTTVGTIVATDPDAGQTRTFSVTGGSGQTVFAVSAAGVITVTNSTALNFEATPSFTLNVTVTDNGTPVLSDTAVITINLTNVNEAPVITSNGGGATAAISVVEHTTLVTTVIASDPDGSPLTFSLSGADAGKFQLTGSGSSRTLSFIVAPSFSTPTDAGLNNVYDVVVLVSDGALSTTQGIAVTVTSASTNPDANDDTATTTLHTPVVINVLANDTDDGSLVPSSVTIDTEPLNGSVSVNGTTGKITYTPAIGFFGVDTFTYKVKDNSGLISNIATVTVNVQHDTSKPVAQLLTDPNNPSKTVLVVLGTNGNDQIRFSEEHHGSIKVTVNGKSLGTFKPTSRIVAFGLSGNDDIRVDEGISLSAELNGGAGNDKLFGGGGNDILNGGDGNDKLFGRKGNDQLFGGAGNDLLVGAQGKDKLDGGPGYDMLIGGGGDQHENNGQHDNDDHGEHENFGFTRRLRKWWSDWKNED